MTPEEEELERKRHELQAVLAALAERELEFVELRRELAAFEGRYLREVGRLYAELDDWQAKVSDIHARLNPSVTARAKADRDWESAKQSRETAYGDTSKTRDFSPDPELKKLFREAARKIHPDLATDPAEQDRRTRLMARANAAYSTGDSEALRRILEEFENGPDSIAGEGTGAELIRVIRQIHLARQRFAALERDIHNLNHSEMARLRREADKAAEEGRDLFADLAADVVKQIRRVADEYNTLMREEESLGR